MSPPRIHSIIAILLLSAMVISGCGTYRNATAYFNTYYNASHLFDLAVAELAKAPQPARDSNYFAPYQTPAGTVKKFESVIEKGSKLIQFHGESGYVQDAILMIGKSYLYQNETESAARKFKELIDNFQGSDKIPEARLWYAKSLYMGKNDEEALVAVKELTAAGQSQIEGIEVDDDLLLEGLMLEAQIYADRGESGIAAKTLARIGTLEGDGRLKAIAQYQLGSVYEATGVYPEAAAAFNMVSEFSPDPDMAFNAKLREGVMLSNAGEHNRALETFDEIIEWPLKTTQSALVDLEIANTYWEMGDSAAAFILYGIIDSSYRKTDAAARAYYKRGDIFEHRYLQLDSAMVYYGKARTEFPASSITAGAVRRYTSLDHYFKTHASLAKDDSLWYVALHTDSSGALPDSAALVEQSLPDAKATADPGSADPVVALTPARELAGASSAAGQLLAIDNLSMRALRGTPRHLVADPEDPESGAPPGGNDGGSKDPESALAGLTGPGKTDVKGKGGGDPKKTAPAAKAPAKPTISPEKQGEKVAAARYELGGILFLDLGLVDSALLYYGLIVRDHPASPLVPKAVYAMSEVHRTLGDSSIVDSLYDLLLAEYPRTEYADQVRRSRGMDTTEAVDSPALVRYREAESLLSGEDPDRALTEFKAIYATTTDSVIRPKACYAVGWIYENLVLRLDSAGAWYDRLLKEYPASVYAANARPRVEVKKDTSKLKDYVKINEIKAIPKPQKKALGLIPTENAGGAKGILPGGVDQAGQNDDEDDYYDPEKDIDPDDEIDPDEEVDPDDEEPADPDDDPGSRIPLIGGREYRVNQFPL
jgi:TolA-binding protein